MIETTTATTPRETMLKASDGTGIFARAWVPDAPKRVLVCVQGLGGHGGYYDDLAEAVTPAGTAVVAGDLRGHGRSAGTRGDIDRFSRYLDDVDCVVAWARMCWPDLPLFLMGESMGASIAIHYIARTVRQGDATLPAGLVLIAPVLRPSVQPRPDEAVRFLRFLLLAPSRPALALTGREEVGCRDATFNDRLRADPLFVRYASPRFITKITRWIDQARRLGHAVTMPLLVMRGERDRVAHVAGTRDFLRRVRSGDHRYVVFPDAYHALLADPATPDAMRALNTWLAARSGLTPYPSPFVRMERGV
jgi:alpha-beta hydrolase superfamily lysophospholipase